MAMGDRYEYVVNTTNNTLTFTDMIPTWSEGTAIQLSTTGTLPEPLDALSTYYVVLKDVTGAALPVGTIGLSASKDVAYTPFWIDFTTQGSGREYIATKAGTTSFPKFEINPTRNNIWLSTPVGTLSNILEGPYTDIRVKQTIFDQYGRAIGADKLLTYRQDERSRIAVLPHLQNDVDLFLNNDPYNYIHLGGGHFFVEGYEHFIIFNPYTLSGSLVYDSFLGLSVSSFEVNVSAKVAHTFRPTLGGYYLKGHDFFRNIEGSASDLTNLYDTYAGSDDLITNQQARALLGFTGKSDYLNELGLGSQSQFMFYRGMLHAKGSVASILAYVNSRKFTGAAIDEFWAVKVAELGDKRLQSYPELLLKDLDNIVDDVRLEFLGLNEDPSSPDLIPDINNGFKIISFADDSRWNNLPNQLSQIKQPLFLDGEMVDLVRIFVSAMLPIHLQPNSFDYWYNSATGDLVAWDGSMWSTVVSDKIHTLSDKIVWRHTAPCDDVRVVRRTCSLVERTSPLIHSVATGSTSDLSNSFVVVGDLTRYVFGNQISVSGSTANNGTFVVQDVVYDRLNDITYVVVASTLLTSGIGGTLTFSYYDFGVYTNTTYTSATTGSDTYSVINAESVGVDLGEFRDIMHIYTIRPSFNSINPAKLVARKTNSVIDQITLWHPAYGWNYYRASYNIDSYNNVDPAAYSKSIQDKFTSGHFWNFAEVGTTWIDSSVLGYVPYYDPAIYSNVNDRLGRWGQLAPFADVKVYQWVKSTVPPSDWSALALAQQADITIPSEAKVSGTPRYTTFKRTRLITTGEIQFGSPVVINIPTNLVTDGQAVFLTSTSSLPAELEDKAKYIVTGASSASPQVFGLLDPDTSEVINIDQPLISTEVVNIGNASTPIYTLQAPSNSFVSGDTIKLSTILSGVLPKGSVSSPINSVEYQEIVFVESKTLDSLTELRPTTTYSATVMVDGASRNIITQGVAIETFAELLNIINISLSGVATAELIDSVVKISAGVGHSISIVDIDLFNSISGFDFINIISGDTRYGITNIVIGQTTNTQTFDLLTMDGDMITISKEGVGQLTAVSASKNITIVPEFEADAWIKQSFAQQRVLGSWLIPNINSSATEPNIIWSQSNSEHIWQVGDEVDVYKNSVFVSQGIVEVALDVVSVSTVGTGLVVLNSDYIDVVRPIHTLTEAESSFDPAIDDDGVTLTQWATINEYSQGLTSNGNGGSSIDYYFWVEGASFKGPGAASMSTLEIRDNWSNVPDPYLILQKPQDAEPVIGRDIAPIKYKQAIVRNIAEYVNSSNQYMVQFTVDLSLRDNILGKLDSAHLKNKHEEWIMIRRNQIGNIPRDLWDKATESLMGQSLVDGSPIPTLNRLAFDEKYGTITRYGLESGQTFVDKTLGVQTLINYLKNPNLNFSPIDITDLFSRVDFTTPSGIASVMNEIYTSFSSEHVNGIWFELLQDALSTNPQYKGLMKTSWVAVHCNRLLEVNGIFDS
jgi:hypothetical protein